MMFDMVYYLCYPLPLKMALWRLSPYGAIFVIAHSYKKTLIHALITRLSFHLWVHIPLRHRSPRREPSSPLIFDMRG